MKFSEINPDEPVFKIADAKPVNGALNEHLFIFDMRQMSARKTGSIASGPAGLFIVFHAAVESPTNPREWFIARLPFESVIKKQIIAVSKEYEKKNLKLKDDPLECTFIEHEMFGVILADPERAVKETADVPEAREEMPPAEPGPAD